MKKSIISKAVVLLLLGVAGMSPALAQHGGHGKTDGSTAVQYRPDVTYTLRTDIADGKLVFVGETGAMKGVVNPTLNVPEGAIVQINLVNGDGATHDVSIPDFNVKSNQINDKGASTSIVFKADKKGIFTYICTLPGHVAGRRRIAQPDGSGQADRRARTAKADGQPRDDGNPRPARRRHDLPLLDIQ
jgi:nitrite reductase (NO-forming)